MIIRKGKHLAACAENARQIEVWAAQQVQIKPAERCRRQRAEVEAEGELRPAQAISALRQRQIEVHPLSRPNAHLGDDVRRVHRTADAVNAQFGIANLRMSPEDQLDRIGEIELVIQVADFAAAVFLQLPQRLLHFRWNPAYGAEDVPQKNEQPFAGAVQASGHDLHGVQAQPPGQGQRTDAGHFLRRSVSHEIAELLDHFRIDVSLDENVQ